MPRNLNSSILNVIEVSFSPEVTASNTLNPVHLALATRGYWIQSHILYIPDRYGFFSPGPPRLQVYQGFLSVALLIMTVLTVFCGALVVFFLSLNAVHKPTWKIVVSIAAPLVGTLAMIWVMECFQKHRSPDYDWGDWKLRKD